MPNSDSVQELANFWDSHDLTDFEESMEKVREPVFARGKGTSVRISLKPQGEPTRVALPLAGWVSGITPDNLLPPGHWTIVPDSSVRYLEDLHEQCRTLVAGRPLA